MEKSRMDFHYEQGTIEHQRQPEGGRGLSTYEQQLLFDKKELNGKKVLDLGAGPHLKFSVELAEAGIDADITSLSPDFSNKEYGETARWIYPDGKIVAGVGQSLPFKKETFDRIFAFHVEEHLGNKIFFGFIQEMARVLKDGGQATIGPIFEIPGEWAPHEQILEDEQLMKELNSYSIEVLKEPVPEEILPKARRKDSFNGAWYVSAYNIVLNKKENGVNSLKNTREK